MYKTLCFATNVSIVITSAEKFMWWQIGGGPSKKPTFKWHMSKKKMTTWSLVRKVKLLLSFLKQRLKNNFVVRVIMDDGKLRLQILLYRADFNASVKTSTMPHGWSPRRAGNTAKQIAHPLKISNECVGFILYEH